jgi:hypothetical protein
MNSLHSPRFTYGVAFLLGGLLALLAAAPARAVEYFRLDRVGIVRFVRVAENTLHRYSGVLHQDGRVFWRPALAIPRPANIPEEALDRLLITNAAWLNYRALASTALDNFELTDGAVRITIGDESYHFIAPNPFGYIASGRVINLSTRARVGAAGDEVVAGFVIEDQPRMVLVRAVGPSLAKFGVPEPVVDPSLSIQHNGHTLSFNDNWSHDPNSAEIRQVAAMVGAFPLDEHSRDAAKFLLLPPGAYTVHVKTANPVSGGEVLVEIYSVPDEMIVIE